MRRLLLLALLVPSVCIADKCPKFIAELSTGQMRPSKGNYLCYDKKSTALKAGIEAGSPGTQRMIIVGEGDTRIDNLPYFEKRKILVIKYNFNPSDLRFGRLNINASSGHRPAASILDIQGIESGTIDLSVLGKTYFDIIADGRFTLEFEY